MYDMAVSININSICCPKEIEKSTEQIDKQSIEKSTEQIDKQSSDPFFCYLVKYVNSNQTREIVFLFFYFFYRGLKNVCLS